ncbi:MAG: hypothetical protein SRB2_01152 [Desulfobacteraceae bacterium Eth-SRB2]|nr:MAG: hypothetical protein SRB2_01152 [Desulfobacteraceae bacterium Eth-SRB2]
MPVVIFFVCLDLERKSSLINRLINEKFEKEIPMAPILTLKGIDQAISSLKYINKNTLKYRYVHHIRQFYSNENSVEPVGEIGNEELIKILWDTGGSFEEIKKKRKNLNNLRSSVNADFKKLYDKGGNPEGIKIGPGNIFVMLDDAKDKILNEFGYDLQPDGTLKLDQIMDILRLANETVSGSMAVQEKEVGKDGLSKIDQLKSLIKGLSEKVGLSSPELSETDHKTQGALDGSMAFQKVNDLGEVPDEIAGEGEIEGCVEEVDELEEDEVLETVDDLEDVLNEIAEEDEIEENLDEIEDLEEDEIIEEVEDVDPDELTEGPEDSERAGGQDDLKGTGIDSGVDTSGSGEGPDGVGALEKDAGMGSQSEDTGDGHVAVGDGVGSEGGMGPYPLIGDELPEGMEIDDSQEIEEVEDLEEDEVLETVDDLEDVLNEIAEEDETEENLEKIEDLEEDEVLETVDDLEDVFDEIAEEDEIEENLDEIEDLEEDEILEEVEDVDIDDTVDETGFDGAPGGVGENFDEDNGKDGIKKAEGAKENEEIGLPVDSLGKEYSDELSDKVKKDSLLAEEFDGYLGVMDRYYNHYILIPGGEYIVGTKKPGKDEKSEQLISLSPFYIGRFPVTNGLFEIFVEKTGYKTMAEKVGYGNVYYGRFQRKKDETTGLMISTWNSSLYCETVEGACWYQPCGPGSTLHNKRNHPVVQISIEDAVAFAAWTGKRLPTENEWEAASRTGKGWIFPWGKEWKKHSCNIENSCTGDTTPVEKYAEFENDFGIADTIGNILEWTFDDVTAQSDNKNKYRYHIAKGGSWISGDDIKLFSRFKIEPESHSNILGFRCVAH